MPEGTLRAILKQAGLKEILSESGAKKALECTF
jgi:hypothetical protein